MLLTRPRLSVEDPDNSVCPNCGGHGLARALSIKQYLRTTSYECEICDYKWSSGNSVPTEILSYPSYPRLK